MTLKMPTGYAHLADVPIPIISMSLEEVRKMATETDLVDELARRLRIVDAGHTMNRTADEDWWALSSFERERYARLAHEGLRQMRYAAKTAMITTDLTTSGRRHASHFSHQLAPEGWAP